MLFSIFFTTIFLTVNHLHSTFASPIVSKGDVGQSLNLMHSLAKRNYIPPDQKCSQPSQWLSRTCRPTISDMTWEDKCLFTMGHMSVTTYVLSTCPADKMCANILSPEPNPRHTIACVDRPTGVTVSNTQQQTGVVRVGRSFDGTQRRSVAIPVLSLISHASVSAFMEGTDGNYVVAANSPINCTLRKTTTTTCNYNVTNRDCVPTGLYDFNKGNILDFTFGLEGGQIVRFYYAIMGS